MSEKQKKDDCLEERKERDDSPFGIVKDEEILARFVLLSEDVDGENYIQARALKVKKFRKEDGWSLLRERHVNDMSEELEKFAKKRNRRSEDYGYALVKVSDIRKISDKSRQISDKIKRRAICVIDDPQPKDPAHALAQKAREYSKSEAKSIRNDLIETFREFGEVIKLPSR